MLGYEYGATYTKSTAKKYVGDIAFAGTVVGQLLFGWLSDHWSRTNSLLVSTIILVIFTALAAGSYYHGDAVGMFNILTAWRFFVSRALIRMTLLECGANHRCQVGIGIGGEYPAGSVGCAESTGELKKGSRNLWFIMFTNTMIDWVSRLPISATYSMTNGYPGVCYRRLRALRCCCGLPKRTLQHHLADQSRHWRRLPNHPVRTATPTKGTRRVHTKLDEICQNPLFAGFPILRLASIRRQLDLVHLRCRLL